MAEQLSVVMPCFNAAPYVEQAVESALQQAGGDTELVVVDDGSTDGSGEILQRLAQRHAGRLMLLHTQRIGPYPARNLALQQVRGEWIAFLDADDWWAPNFGSAMLAALQASGADAAYCGWQNVGIAGPRGEPYVPPDYLAEGSVENFLRHCPWPIHAAVLRRSVVERLGGFSERMFSSMDYDFWIRMLGVTQRLVRVTEVMAFYRWHGSGQISAAKARQVLHAWQVRRDFVQAHPALAATLPASKRRELVDGALMAQGRSMFWRRDLGEAQPVLRQALRTGAWGWRDLPMLMAAQLPAPWFQRLLQRRGREGM